jgi:hypothetical protein
MSVYVKGDESLKRIETALTAHVEKLDRSRSSTLLR